MKLVENEEISTETANINPEQMRTPVKISLEEIKHLITTSSRGEVVISDSWASLVKILESTISAMASISPESTMDSIKQLNESFEDLEKLKADIQEKHDSIFASLEVEVVEKPKSN